MDTDSRYMERALDLAKLGLGRVAPNPMVGAVIVHKGYIIGEGYHQVYGGPHAEVNAISSVKDKNLLKESTIYVNLEPCNHTGLTPPCTNLIIEHSVPRVVVGQIDPNPLVGGKGIERLKNNGIDVEQGVLEEESLDLNKRFNTFHKKKRPFIILKWAQTEDGFVDAVRNIDDPVQPNWITDEFCRRLVHKWRSEEPAIIVGTETAKKDNPQLNVRSWSGKSPLRLVIDRNLRLDKSLYLFDGSIPTIIFNAEMNSTRENLQYIKLDFSKDILQSIMNELYEKSLQSLIVEGGPILLNSFIKQGLWDEARIFTGPLNFGNGVLAPEFPFSPSQKIQTGNSLLEIFTKK